ncbi:MAG: acyl carrier protein [Polyangiales bacterium]
MGHPEILVLVVQAVASVLDRSPGAITEETPVSSLGLDSVGFIEVVADLERSLSIRIPDDKLTGIASVRDVCALVARAVDERDRAALAEPAA